MHDASEHRFPNVSGSRFSELGRHTDEKIGGFTSATRKRDNLKENSRRLKPQEGGDPKEVLLLFCLEMVPSLYHRRCLYEDQGIRSQNHAH